MPQIQKIDDEVIKIMNRENYEAGLAMNKEYEESKKRTILAKYLNEYKKKFDLKRGDKLLSEISKKISDGSIKTKQEIDKYFNQPKSKPTKDSVKSKIKSSIKDIQKNQIENLIKDVKKTKIKPVKSNTKAISKAMDLADEMVKHSKVPKYTSHKTSDNLIDTIFNIASDITKSKKSKKLNTSEGDEIISKIEKKLNTIVPTPATPSETQKIDTLAKSIIDNPTFDNINKQKLEKYSFNIVYNFNQKYPELMLKLFKTKENIDKLLKKKTDNIQKRVLSEEKAKARKIKYAEAGKAKRAEAKQIKNKMVNELSPEEKKKYLQARNYYMRKSKTSTILPKNLNKEDPEALKYVCIALAEKGFDYMTEQLFMKELEE